MTCVTSGKFRYFYTGNQVGDYNFCGDFNFCAGGLPGLGISSGVTVPLFFASAPTRFPWKTGQYELTQELLEGSFPFIDLQWICDIHISDTEILRVSNRNIYVEDADGSPRFYEARASKAPKINITSGEWLSPGFEIGDMKVELNNRDGHFNQYLAHGTNYVQWHGNKVQVKIGFGEKLSNYHTYFEGFITVKKGLETTDKTIVIHAYDRFDRDELPIPPTSFDQTNYPNVEKNFKGKAVPLLYGDWSVDVNDYGEIPAVCANALDDLATYYVFQIAQNSLREIGDIYLHRGKRKEGDEGPIKLISGAVTKEPEKGRFYIDISIPSLTEAYPTLKDKRAGTGSGLNLIISETAELDFVAEGVKVGDTVLKTGSSIVSLVLGVLPGQLSLSGGITWAKEDQYTVLTDEYSYRKGDKMSVFCKGKDITTMSKARLSDIVSGIVPTGVSVTLRNSAWVVDNDIQKIYELSFEGTLIRSFDFSDIDASITEINGISEAFDNTLWLFDKPTSTIYRFLLKGEVVGLSFQTAFTDGLLAALTDGRGLTVNEGNELTLVDNFTGDFYVINPFIGTGPAVTSTFNITAFDSLAVDITDLSADVNANNLVVVDRQTNKMYRIHPTTGALVSEITLDPTVEDDFSFPMGVSSFQDGTVFILNRTNNTVYNFNEFTDANENAGWIARDLLQSYAGRTSLDFDLEWNQTCRDDLSSFYSRAYINKKDNVVKYLVKFLQQTNSLLYSRFQKYSLYHITFDNFTTEGKTMREGDMILGTFKPSKEHNQYFNSAQSEYKLAPFSKTETQSDIYISPLGIQLSGREVNRTLEMDTLYRREDVDQLVPLMVRLAAAEPEFISVSVGMKFLFSQITDFYNINYYDINCETQVIQSGRRFDYIPSFIRKMVVDLDKLRIDLKLWSLGTTQFGNFVPTGTVAGGQYDDIILTNLGTPGYITPFGTITASGVNSLTLEDVGGEDAETRTHVTTGLAWLSGYKVALVDGSDHSKVEVLTIQSVLGQVVTFVEDIVASVTITSKNSAGFTDSGHYLRYANYDEVINDQTTRYGYYGKPDEGYPQSTTEEIEEQRANKHNFDNDRLPYLLHPKDFVFA